MILATTKERLLQYLDYKGISKSTFFLQTGLKRGFLDADKITAIVSDVFLAIIIANYTDLRLEWLITGEGDMLKSSEGRPASQSPPATSIIYKSDPRDLELLDLQRKQIKLLEEKLEDLKKEPFGYVSSMPTPPAAASASAKVDPLVKVPNLGADKPSKRP